MIFYRAAWMGVTFMVSALGVAVALLSDHAKVNCAVSAAVGIATGAITCAAQGARCVSDYRRQALTAAAIGAAGCCAIAGLTTLFGHQALLVLVWLAVTPPPAVRHVIASAHRVATHRWPLPELQIPAARQADSFRREIVWLDEQDGQQPSFPDAQRAHRLNQGRSTRRWMASLASLWRAQRPPTREKEGE
jgi:hypothetical protein